MTCIFDALILDSHLPQAFAAGFATVEKVMRALFVRKLYLRPRFHAAVSAALNAQPIDVVEIAQPLTPGMRAVQELVLDVMRACVDELRASRRGELEHVTLEAAFFHSFDANIRRDLGPMWHKLRCGHWALGTGSEQYHPQPFPTKDHSFSRQNQGTKCCWSSGNDTFFLIPPENMVNIFLKTL